MKTYINIDNILGSAGPVTGIIGASKSVQNVKFDTPDDLQILTNVYTPKGDFINQIDEVEYTIISGELLCNLTSVFTKLSLVSGSYKLGMSVVKLINKVDIIELSPDKTELKIKFIDYANVSNLSLRINGVRYIINNIWSEINYTYIKLDSEYDSSMFNALIVLDLTDEIFNTVNLFKALNFKKSNTIKGPRFDIDADSTNSEISIFKTWEDLLSTDKKSSQEIIDSIFNRDNSVTLNIDWSRLGNYIFYSRAKPRIENFYQKMLMIEEYSDKIISLDSISGTESTEQKYNTIIRQMITSFDSFERYLYYTVDPKIFTHDTIGPILPWPKHLVSGDYQLLPSTHATTISWYNTINNIAELYDQGNLKSLWYSIPEHLLMNEANSEYVLFVEMIGQHFDNIWLYVNALTEIHNKDEHPERGPAKELLSTIANSFGWKLANNRNLSDLWLYKLGQNADGTPVLADNMLTHESQSEQVWRRIVNNLPALLKSKGTSKSIKSLMSIYGIPSTLISIKEYGGTSLNDEPIFIEDRYHYKLRMAYGRTIDFELLKGQEIIDTCNLTIFNGDFSKGLLDWGVQIINGGSYPEIDENLGSIDNANAIFCPSAGTILTKNLNLEKNKRYKIQFRTWRPNTPPPDDNTGRFQLEFNGENVLLYDGPNPYLNGGASDADFVWTIYLIGDVENLLEIYTFDDNISFWEFKIEEVAFPERYPDTYEFRFQFTEDQGEDPDFFKIALSDPFNIDYQNVVVFSLLPISSGDTVNLERRKLVISDNDAALHESAEINLPFNEFYTFRLYRDMLDPTRFHYNLANSSNSLLGEINNEISGSFTSSELLLESKSPVLMLQFVSGYLQGYKEYFGNYSYDTFKKHVLNPASYSTDEYNGAYNKLFTYYPFGLDLQKFGHTSSAHPSSQPNRNFASSAIALSGFSENQSENYINDSETYYIDSPNLGGRSIYSKKIRISDSQYENAVLNIDSRASTANTYSNSDSNRLAIVFSLSDQINRDIFNHINSDSLNNSIGSPLDEFEDSHSELTTLRRMYFKKYQSRNDINAFIRLLSAYDYTFFEQIKQLTPGSANLIAGILIEPHILEKNKNIVLKPIKIDVENVDIDYNLKTAKDSAEIEYLETGIISSRDIGITESKFVTTLNEKFDLMFGHSKLTTVLHLDYTTQMRYFKLIKGSGIAIQMSGLGGLEPMIENPRVNCKYTQKDYQYTDETRPEYSFYKYQDVDDATSSLDVDGYNYADLNLILNTDKRPFNRFLEFPDSSLSLVSGSLELDVLYEQITIPAGDYIIRFYIEWVDGSSIVDDNAVVELEFSGMTTSGSGGFDIPHSISSDLRIMHPHQLTLTLPSDDIVDLTVKLKLLDGVNCSSKFRIYGFDIYNDIGLYNRELIMLNNRLNENYQFSTLSPTSYQTNEESSANNIRFTGSKITSPGWNQPSNDVDHRPVVEFNIVDPQTLIIESGKDSNLKVI